MQVAAIRLLHKPLSTPPNVRIEEIRTRHFRMAGVSVSATELRLVLATLVALAVVALSACVLRASL
jgi:hypothetical protein